MSKHIQLDQKELFQKQKIVALMLAKISRLKKRTYFFK